MHRSGHSGPGRYACFPVWSVSLDFGHTPSRFIFACSVSIMHHALIRSDAVVGTNHLKLGFGLECGISQCMPVNRFLLGPEPG